jgi:hypothetical protein
VKDASLLHVRSGIVIKVVDQHLSIEAELERIATADNNLKGLWTRYYTMKDYLAAQYYPYIQANCPYFTDHGQLHIESTIETASQILLPSPKNIEKLGALDFYLLLCAIIWHDAGNVYDRSSHAEQVSQMITRINNEIFFYPTIQRLVTELVKAHTGEDGLDIPLPEQDCVIGPKTFTVYPKALAAVVRFADEISENRSRISPVLLNEGKVPEKNVIYWEYANCIVASRADPLRERIVVTVEIEADRATKRYQCPEECKEYSGEDGSISFIEYAISRLQKMNNERAYCAREFAMYASIRKIEVRLMLTQGGDRVKEYTNEFELHDSGLHGHTYPKIKFFEDFFEHHPRWRPNNITEWIRK